MLSKNNIIILQYCMNLCKYAKKIVLYVTFQTTCENSSFNVSLVDPIGAKPIFVKISNVLLQRTLYCRPKYCLMFMSYKKGLLGNDVVVIIMFIMLIMPHVRLCCLCSRRIIKGASSYLVLPGYNGNITPSWV